MAYLVDILTAKCSWCGRRAVKRLKNRVNADVEDLCARHAATALKKLQALEDRESANRVKLP